MFSYLPSSRFSLVLVSEPFRRPALILVMMVYPSVKRRRNLQMSSCRPLKICRKMNLKYFKESEFENCNPPCKMEDCNPRALECLDKLRDSCGFPLVLTSAYRSHKWNVEHGRNYHSKHEDGIAFDIHCVDSYRRAELVFKARFYGFNGIGIYPNFVHIDMRRSPSMWYGK